MSWSQLDPKQSAEFLKAVTGNGDPIFFEPSLCEVHELPLTFFDGYSLIRIVNKHSIPYLLLDYLSNGEQHYYLDGSERAFHNVNAQGAIHLDETNVLGYIDMFISYVYERGNSLLFLRDAEAKASISTPVYDEANGHFKITLPLLYQEQRVMADIEVTVDGKIFVRAPLEVSFLTTLHPDAANPYLHPHEAQIIEQSKSLLSTTETGQKLMQTAAEIHVMGSPNYHGFITNDRKIYLMMPAAEQSAKYTQALLLAGYLANAVQILDGYQYPHHAVDKDLYLAVNYGKNLDMLLEMCRMVNELEAQNNPEGLNTLTRFGLGAFYEGFKQNLNRSALLDLYFEALEKQGLLSPERK